MPSKTLAAESGLSVSTVHRAFELLRDWGAVEGAPGERPRARAAATTPTPVPLLTVEQEPSGLSGRHWTATLRGSDGRRFASRVVTGTLADPDTFRAHLLGIARIEDPEHTDDGEDWIGQYELEVAPLGEEARTPATVLRW